LKIGLLRSLLKTAALLDFVEGKVTNVESESEEQVNADRSLAIDVDELDDDDLPTNCRVGRGYCYPFPPDKPCLQVSKYTA
jgi:hypothetical protein